MRAFLIPLVLLLVLPVLACAETYYVSPSGSDSNSGLSTSQAWRTIGKANAELYPGDTVRIMAGTYSETIEPARSGSSNNYITYENYNNQEVNITGVHDAVDLRNRNYIVIDGIRIRDITGSWVNMLSSVSTHNIIRNCDMGGDAGWS